MDSLETLGPFQFHRRQRHFRIRYFGSRRRPPLPARAVHGFPERSVAAHVHLTFLFCFDRLLFVVSVLCAPLAQSVRPVSVAHAVLHASLLAVFSVSVLVHATNGVASCDDGIGCPLLVSVVCRARGTGCAVVGPEIVHHVGLDVGGSARAVNGGFRLRRVRGTRFGGPVGGGGTDGSIGGVGGSGGGPEIAR